MGWNQTYYIEKRHSAAYSTQTKLRISKTNMAAVLLYGCETWKNAKFMTAKLQVFINPYPANVENMVSS